VLTFGDQVYVNEPVPPLAVTVTVPLLAPLQVTSVFVEVAVGLALEPIVTLAVAEHKLASFTVTVYVPAFTFVMPELLPPELLQV
jgi:hypothetical protein